MEIIASNDYYIVDMKRHAHQDFDAEISFAT